MIDAVSARILSGTLSVIGRGTVWGGGKDGFENIELKVKSLRFSTFTVLHAKFLALAQFSVEQMGKRAKHKLGMGCRQKAQRARQQGEAAMVQSKVAAWGVPYISKHGRL